MLIFRLVCTLMMAWAMNWAVGRPESAALLAEIPEMAYTGPIAGALVGFFILSKRMESGIVLAIAHGAWTGLVAIAAAAVIYLSVEMVEAVRHNLVRNFEAFLRILGTEAKPFIEFSTDYRMFGITIAATTVTGLVSGLLYWCLRYIRRQRGEPEPKKQVRAAVARAGSHI